MGKTVVNLVELFAVLGVGAFGLMFLYQKYQAQQQAAAASAQFNDYVASVQDEALIATLGNNPFGAPASTTPTVSSG